LNTDKCSKALRYRLFLPKGFLSEQNEGANVKRYSSLTKICLGLTLSMSFVACSAAKRAKTGRNPETLAVPGSGSSVKSDSISAFGSEAEMQLYFSKIFADLESHRIAAEKVVSSAAGSIESSAPSASPSDSSGADEDTEPSSPSASTTNETITNNQEVGVDEGGIVKNIGDSLVILRHGQLFAAKTNPSAPIQTDHMAVARNEALAGSVWYDEMLVKGDLVYVIGYRYGNGSNEGEWEEESSVEDDFALANPCQPSYYGAVEVNSFQLKAGKFVRLQTQFFESADYYSFSNYTSRMIDGKLLMYSPYQASDYCSSNKRYSIHIPQELELDANNNFVAKRPLFSAVNVFKNVEEISDSPTFHTIISCDLATDGKMNCSGQALIGDIVQERYVSANAVYLAGSDRVYSLGLKDLKMKAHAVSGSISSQFSFRETADSLQIMMASGSEFDEESETVAEDDYFLTNKAPLPVQSTLSLYSLPLAAFDDRGVQSLDGLSNLLLEGGSYWGTIPRFIGKNLLFSQYDGSKQKIYVYDTIAKKLRSIAAGGSVNRIEIFDENLAFLSIDGSSADRDWESSSSTSSLIMATLVLNQSELVMNSISAQGIYEAEGRSHAFSQKTLADGSHIFGLPTEKTWNATGGGSTLNFFKVDTAAKVVSLGAIKSTNDIGLCKTSCTDWYGNTRPIFLGNRIFALMGQELVELSADGAVMSELGARLRLAE
jgi:hypothetical protein